MGRSKHSPVSFQIADDIVPIGDFKAHLSEKIRELGQRGRPLVITQNGRAAAVLLAPEDFDRLTNQAQFVAAVEEGLADLSAERVVSHDELGRRLDERFGAAAESK